MRTQHLISLSSFFFLLALVFLALAGLGISGGPRLNFGWWGLFCWALSEALPI